VKIQNWVFFLTRRYAFSRRAGKAVAPSVLAMLGIALGTATLIVVIGVMNGYQQGFIRSILEISSYHVRVSSAGGDLGLAQERLRANPHVKSEGLFYETQVLIRTKSGGNEAVKLEVIQPESLSKDEGLRSSLRVAPESLSRAPANSIILGQDLAAYLGVYPGESIDLIGLAVDEAEGLKTVQKTFTVNALFNCDYYDYNRSLIVMGFPGLDGFLKPEASALTLGVKLKNEEGDIAAMDSFKASLGSGYSLVSWRDYNQAFFGALRSEKVLMMAMIGLIFLLVAVNVFNLMKRLVVEKYEDIGLLKAMGARDSEVAQVFTFQGLYIGVVGAVGGTCLGFLLASHLNDIVGLGVWLAGLSRYSGYLAESFPRVSWAELHQVLADSGVRDIIPMRLSPLEVTFTFLCGLASATFSAYLASKAVTACKPQEILRYE
jgi:lipoprotein-releasing system permease protein